MISLRLLPVTLFSLFLFVSANASDIKPDEQILFFPTAAHYDEGAKAWRVPLHGWIFEAEHDSLWRNGAMELLRGHLGLENGAVDNHHLKVRGWPFIVDNERGKSITIELYGSRLILPSSNENGHFHGETTLPAKEMFQPGPGAWVAFSAVMPEGDIRQFRGAVQLVGSTGLSVISDIDDTIKHSHVLEHEELLKNTFLRDFGAIPGMPELYQQWEKQGAVFHYVTGSPWQLYPSLRDFTDSQHFPRGSFMMRNFRLKDSSLITFTLSSYDYKLSTIDKLLNTYPDRRFILVGDSGEKDPEVYAEIARRHSKQVEAIYIRNVTDEAIEDERFSALTESSNEIEWHLFIDGNDLLN